MNQFQTDVKGGLWSWLIRAVDKVVARRTASPRYSRLTIGATLVAPTGSRPYRRLATGGSTSTFGVLVNIRAWLIRHDNSKLAVLLDGGGDAAEVGFARDGQCPEADGNRSQHLDIEQQESFVPQMLPEMKQCDLGRVAGAVEH
jgi:hypothetical protein